MSYIDDSLSSTGDVDITEETKYREIALGILIEKFRDIGR